MILLKKITASTEIIPKILTGDPDELSLTLAEAMINEGMLLYVEIKDSEAYDLKWLKEFEKSNYYFTIKFNNPQVNEENSTMSEF